MKKRPKIIIIGAGIAGLSAAAILSKYCDVTVYDRADTAGGKVQTRALGSGHIDCGPTVFTLKSVFETIFADAGAHMENHITARPASTLARHFWQDGSKLDLFADPVQTADAIANFSSKKEAVNYLKFCKASEQVFAMLSPNFMQAPKPDFMKLVRSQSPTKLAVLNPFSTLWQALNKSFDDPRLIQLFGRYATYCGSSPFECPATLMLVAHVERAGVWLLDGGMNAMVEALAAVATQNGAEIICKSNVDSISFRGKQVSGIQTEDGSFASAEGVLCCADIGAVAAGHYGADAAKAIASQGGAVRSQSAITWTMEAKTNGAELDAHNVFFSDNYKSEFDAVFGAKTVPQAPTVYLHAPPTKTDKARPIFCLINAPANGDTRTYSDKETDQWLTQTVSQMEACGLSLKASAKTIITQSPSTYAARFPGTGGALYGPASHGWQAAFKRHGVRTRRKGFYLAGGSIHPGPGVPMAALSGRSAALAMMEDFNLTDRSHLAGMHGGISMQ